uniref:Uncharacterized protein n=1 Tax=Rhizophora mucronata TaxID=61149 RepID=A0A2P2PSW6_RHIMU
MLRTRYYQIGNTFLSAFSNKLRNKKPKKPGDRKYRFI